MARFEVLGRHEDRDLIQSFAHRLAGDGADAARLRTILDRETVKVPSQTGRILSALRRSPLVGSDLDLSRESEERPLPL
ncbi:hypothetical protein J1C48_04160 [Jiella sp. CQZ9-1]|uniref:Uncharacterized protein n=1 Tax=Jiella flava TaxID=2816857 RepID=A0A939JT47_9HYPH|nr:hypothetical protein [Jiella flava]